MSKSEPGAVPDTTRRGKKDFCVDCGEERREGDYPFCKGGHSGHGAGGYSPFKKYVDPNILPADDPRAQHVGTDGAGRRFKGALIESREQRRHIMKEQCLDWAPRPMGEGGSEV